MCCERRNRGGWLHDHRVTLPLPHLFVDAGNEIYA